MTTIRIGREGRVGLLTLDGPARLNALGSPALDALAEAIRAFEDDDVTRAVVVTGTGRAFSAGADVHEFRGFPGPDQFARFLPRFTDPLALLAGSRLPFV